MSHIGYPELLLGSKNITDFQILSVILKVWHWCILGSFPNLSHKNLTLFDLLFITCALGAVAPSVIYMQGDRPVPFLSLWLGQGFPLPAALADILPVVLGLFCILQDGLQHPWPLLPDSKSMFYPLPAMKINNASWQFQNPQLRITMLKECQLHGTLDVSLWCMCQFAGRRGVAGTLQELNICKMIK